MWEALAALIMAAVQEGIAAEKKSEEEQAAVEAQARAALAALKGIQTQMHVAHDDRTAETVKEIEDASKR